jgi:hypothetical protein
MITLYWVSAIVQNDTDDKAWLLSMSDSVISLEKAMDTINWIRTHHKTLSVWIDVFDENNNKQTIFHECYVNVFGYVDKPEVQKDAD